METGRFKFRFWHKSTKKMLGCYGFNEHCTFANTLDGINTEYNPCATKDCVLMQSTGLKDKNEQFIYEGDIVYRKGLKRYNGEKLYSKVVWDSTFAAFVLSDENGIHRMPYNLSKTEIVGNIYENNEFEGI